MGTPRETVCGSLASPQHSCTLTLFSRDYPLKKIQENNEAEILQTVLDDARESYAEEIIVELRSETTEDMESNVSRIVEWINNWRRDHPAS